MPHLTLFGGFFALFSKNLPKTINFSNSQSPFFIDEQEVGCWPSSVMRSPLVWVLVASLVRHLFVEDYVGQ